MHRLRSDRSLLALLGILGSVGLLLLATSIDGVFIADEDQYLSFATAARRGEVFVPGTAGLPAAKGLAYFVPTDPTPKPVPENFRTPVPYGVSPLHAYLAAPLTYLGWRGLVALNAFGFCLAACFVFLLARRFASKPSTPWIAAGVFLFSSFSIEYAQGVWPHMLSAGLCTAAVYFAARHRDTDIGLDASLAGLLAGLAFGVRLQALLFVVFIAVGLLVLSRRGSRAAAFYALGLALPILACSLINHASRGTWNPISRGTAYITPHSGGLTHNPLVEWGLLLWARVFDYSAFPELSGPYYGYLTKEPFSGATMIAGSFKKALLQSAPWVAIPLVGLVASWLRPARERTSPSAPGAGAGGGLGPAPEGSASAEPPTAGWLTRLFRGDGREREVRAIALIVVGLFAALAVRGPDDGLAFNQRYLLDLMPLLAVVLAWRAEPLELRPVPLIIGAGSGLILYLIAYLALPLGLGLVFAMKAPLVLAALLLLGWALAGRARAEWPAVALMACLSWAACVHLFDDLAASRNIRRTNHARMMALAPELRDGDALFAFWGDKDAFGPLQMDRDLLIVDSSPDEPQTLARLTRALLDRGRRVLVIPRLPADKLAAMSEGLDVQALGPFEVGEGHPALRLLQLSTPTAPDPRREAEAQAR